MLVIEELIYFSTLKQIMIAPTKTRYYQKIFKKCKYINNEHKIFI